MCSGPVVNNLTSVHESAQLVHEPTGLLPTQLVDSWKRVKIAFRPLFCTLFLPLPLLQLYPYIYSLYNVG